MAALLATSFALLLLLLSSSVLEANSNNDQCESTKGSGENCAPILEKHMFYINGTWVHPQGDSTSGHNIIDPSTGNVAATISFGGKVDTDTAVAAAKQALPTWKETLPSKRRALIERLLEIYVDRSEQMAQFITLEMGAPIDMSRSSQVGAGEYAIEEFLKALDEFEFEHTIVDDEDYGGGAATQILMEPIGIVGLITPWNWPMNQVVLKVVPALAVGCTCILKPSELAPLSSMLFAEMIDEAGFPPGVFNLVNGDGEGVGTQLTTHPDIDMISFTGSTRAGALVSKAAADTFKRVTLELGGKGANIIFSDVDDLEETVTEGVYGCFENSGQTCNAPTRMLVERSVYDKAVSIATKVAEDMEVKSGHAEGDHLGPVVSLKQYEKIQKYIETGIKEKGRLVAGGLGRPSDGIEANEKGGFYVRPTIFADVNNDMTIMKEEIFGPVLCIMPFKDEEEALSIANDTPYGLTNYLHTTDGRRRNRLARRLRSGIVMTNSMPMATGTPFGGVKASGNGREGGVYGLQEYCEVKAITGWDYDDETTKEQ